MTQQMQIRAIETDNGSKFNFDGSMLVIDDDQTDGQARAGIILTPEDIEGLVWLLTGNKRRVPRTTHIPKDEPVGATA